MFKDTGVYKMLKGLQRLLYVLRREFIRATDPLTGYYWERRQFLRRHGYPLDLRAPKSFNEKVVWKKLFDRNPVLPEAADKFAVRGYVRRVLGEERAKEFLVPLLHATDDPDTIPFDSLPDEYIVKSNHGSGWNIIVRGDADPEAIRASAREWLGRPYGRGKYEWAYQKMKRMIVIETLLRDERGSIPKDYKFYMFHGKCGLVQVDFERFEGHSRSLFDADWNMLKTTYIFPQGRYEEKPANFDRMMALAQELSRPLDFVRVDLYSFGDRIYVGELTHYPGAGTEPFRPNDIDFKMGSMWTIDARKRGARAGKSR